MDFYKQLKENLIKCDIYDQVKDYSKNRNRVITYYENGKILKEAGKEYGKNIIKQYAEKLMLEVGKKYNERTLYGMRKFYEVFSDEKLTAVRSILTWSHYRELLKLKNTDEIIYYINMVKTNNLTHRQLQVVIKNKEYERLPESTKNKLINKEETSIEDNIKNRIIIRNNDNEEINEKILQKLILEDITHFMKELGEGYSFIDNEYKIKIGDNYNYIDLLFFNYIYNSFVVVELKVTELKKEHIGQIEVYMNYIDRNLKSINQNKTIGIIICRKNNEYVIEYCTDKRILGREYELIS